MNRPLATPVKLCISVLFLVLLNACVSAPQSAALRQQTPMSFSAPVLLDQVPFFAQELYQCGPAALATLLGASGVAVTPDELVPWVYLPERQGSFQIEMVAATRSFGRLSYQIAPTLDALLTEVEAGKPVLVLQNLSVKWYPRWHFAVVKGFDLKRQTLILNSGLYENYEMPVSTFERTWARADYWGVLALEPGDMPAQAEPLRYFTALAAFAQNHPAEISEPAYKSGLQAWPNDANLLMAYGNLLYQENQPTEAASQFSQVLVYHPDYAPAHNNLAHILFEQGQHALALTHAQHAVRLGGDYINNYRASLRMIETAQ